MKTDPGQLSPEKAAEYARMPELTRCRECRYWEGSKAYGGHWCSLMGPGCGPEFYCANGRKRAGRE